MNNVANITFDELYSRLKQLVSEIENEDIALESLTEKINEARALAKQCEQKLRTTEDGLDTSVME